eukprot:1160690-Pelagomonas_calceolata.AAC.22
MQSEANTSYDTAIHLSVSRADQLGRSVYNRLAVPELKVAIHTLPYDLDARSSIQCTQCVQWMPDHASSALSGYQITHTQCIQWMPDHASSAFSICQIMHSVHSVDARSCIQCWPKSSAAKEPRASCT